MTGTNSPLEHRKIRLPAEVYWRAGTSWLVTVSAADRASRPFVSEGLAGEVVSVLETSHRLRACRLLAYCLVPDHLHFVTTVEDGGDVLKLADGFKSFSTKVWRDAGGSGPLWQLSFHDRGLRSSDDIEVALRYVWGNPQRAGLISEGHAYVHRGGEFFEAT